SENGPQSSCLMGKILPYECRDKTRAKGVDFHRSVDLPRLRCAGANRSGKAPAASTGLQPVTGRPRAHRRLWVLLLQSAEFFAYQPNLASVHRTGVSRYPTADQALARSRDRLSFG